MGGLWPFQNVGSEFPAAGLWIKRGWTKPRADSNDQDHTYGDSISKPYPMVNYDLPI